MIAFTKKRRKASLTQPSLERLLGKVPSKYELVLLASKRARQIKREIDFRPERAREYEFTKPLTTALFEIVEGRVTAEDLKYVDLLADTETDESGGFVPTEAVTKRFFEEEVAQTTSEVEDFGHGFEDLEESDAIAGISEE